MSAPLVADIEDLNMCAPLVADLEDLTRVLMFYRIY